MKRSMGMGTAPRVAVVSSSPGRTEKLPAPPGLARLLRGKSGSRSRGRSSVARSSSMFVSRRQAGPSSSEARAEDGDGEPSSPKVTCIGQVRIRGKNGKPKPKPTPTPGSKKPKPEYPHRTWPTVRWRCCCCLERPLLFKRFLKPPASGPHRWWSLGRRRRESIAREEPVAAAATARVSISVLGDQEDDVADGEEVETRVFMSSTPTPPPKNALLLMRCRSAPHDRSSSSPAAFTRFAVSPPAGREEEGDETEEPADGRNSCKSHEVIGGTVVLKRCKSVPARMLVAPERRTAIHYLASPPSTKNYTMRPWLTSVIF